MEPGETTIWRQNSQCRSERAQIRFDRGVVVATCAQRMDVVSDQIGRHTVSRIGPLVEVAARAQEPDPTSVAPDDRGDRGWFLGRQVAVGSPRFPETSINLRPGFDGQ